jgi:hypothetical protein
MKFISSEAGQSLQLIVMDEVRPPRGGPFLPDATAAIARRYRFVSAPTQADPAQPVKFQTGAIVLDGITFPVYALEIYDDGIIINAHSTDEADAIMDDFINWAIEEFHYRKQTTKFPRQYYSTIVISLDKSLNTFISNFHTIRNQLAKAFSTDENALEVIRLSVGPHPAGTLPYRATWSIEPRMGGPVVHNRYFSAAPLSTAAHVQLLVALEAAAER